MSKLPSMPFFPADFFADTEHLSRAAAHAYLFLLGHAWLRGARLPNDDAALARMAGFRLDQWKKIKAEVMEFWRVGDDGMLRNPRQHGNFETVNTNRNINIANGKLGGRPKSLFSNVPIKANGFNLETEKKGNQNQNQNKEESLNGEVRQESGNRVFVKEGSPQWNAWEPVYRQEHGVGPPKDHPEADRTAVGWWFPSEWPPQSPLRPKSN
jgi:uncharacterized protein YdaU (DUF1376 family)